MTEVNNHKPPTATGQQKRPRKPILIPHGQIVAMVERGMQLNRRNKHAAAKEVGVPHHKYLFIYRLLTLKTQELPHDEHSAVLEALQLCDQHKFVQARSLTSEIITRRWRPYTKQGIIQNRSIERASARQQKRFDATIFAIREACTNNDELQIPTLDPEERMKYLDSIQESVDALFDLKRKIKGDVQ